MNITILITGGTIDNLEYGHEDDVPKRQKSLIPDLIKQARITESIETKVVCFKDSKFVNDTDREKMLLHCKTSSSNNIIITHGTMTMPETAMYLGVHNLKKTIVLFGAAVPGNKSNSDALFNLGLAMAAVKTLAHGVYVTMNGQIFSHDNVKKNLETGNFETLS
jgi:L-asparaginase